MAAIEKDQLRHFLGAASSLDFEGAADIRTMFEAGIVFDNPFTAFAANEDTYMDSKANDVVAKITHILDNIDKASENKKLWRYLMLWLNIAADDGLYMPPPPSPSGSSASSRTHQ